MTGEVEDGDETHDSDGRDPALQKEKRRVEYRVTGQLLAVELVQLQLQLLADCLGSAAAEKEEEKADRELANCNSSRGTHFALTRL